MIARFYAPPYCVFCKMLAPKLKRLAKRLGIDLEVYKVDDQGMAHQIGGDAVMDVRRIPAFPAVVLDEFVLIGTDILTDARRIIKAKRRSAT